MNQTDLSMQLLKNQEESIVLEKKEGYHLYRRERNEAVPILLRFERGNFLIMIDVDSPKAEPVIIRLDSLIGLTKLTAPQTLRLKDQEKTFQEIFFTYMPKVTPGCCKDNGKRVPTDMRLFFEENETFSFQTFVQDLTRFIILNRELLIVRDYFIRRFLIFLNPASGSGQAVARWNIVEPIFRGCGYTLDVVSTTRAHHAHDYVQELPLDTLLQYSGIITVSGDGLPHEVINALLSRPDAEEAKQVPLGLLPGGSGNALLESVCHISKEKSYLENAAFLIAHGKTSDLDITLMETQSGKRFYSFLSFAWGFIADVDLESEFMRCCGGARFDIYGVWRVLAMREYPGRIFISETVASTSELPALDTEIEESQDWRKIDGPFISVLIMNTPFLSKGLHASPQSRLDDGLLYIQTQRGGNHAGRYRLIKYMLSQPTGDHLQNGNVRNDIFVDYHKLKAFRIEPSGPNQRPFSIDGERFAPERVHGVVLPKYYKVFANPTEQ
eukprot:TRINITY_DN3466_c0_g1_i4.p1 TRINITY_DN3466_c0_g1~~TRINITY_DN3466_c0_g1_i4.p1  ORF type:complete len:498 (+),score=93.38 TRINITY_DN3466_c0_g1_i4:35-1528(+)